MSQRLDAVHEPLCPSLMPRLATCFLSILMLLGVRPSPRREARSLRHVCTNCCERVSLRMDLSIHSQTVSTGAPFASTGFGHARNGLAWALLDALRFRTPQAYFRRLWAPNRGRPIPLPVRPSLAPTIHACPYGEPVPATRAVSNHCPEPGRPRQRAHSNRTSTTAARSIWGGSMNRFKLLTITALTLIASARSAAANQVTESFSMPVTMQVSAATTGCTNSPGPQITFGGQFALEGLNANLTFSNNAKGTHTHTDGTQVSAAILAAGQSVVLPKQPSSGGVGGNPFIWCQMLDGNGRAITDEIILGRCVQGNFQTQAHFALPMRAVVDLDVANCSNSPGPIITFGGSLSLASGLKARL